MNKKHLILAEGESAKNISKVTVSRDEDDAVRGLIVNNKLEDLH